MSSVKILERVEKQRKEKLEQTHKIINDIDHKFCNQHEIIFPEENPWIHANEEYFYNNKIHTYFSN